MERPTDEQEAWYWTISALGVGSQSERLAFTSIRDEGVYVRLTDGPDLWGYVAGPFVRPGPALAVADAWCHGRLNPPVVPATPPPAGFGPR